jgi:Uma2 family endonuclease
MTVKTMISPTLPLTPWLNDGDRLNRAEFHRRYEMHPEIKKAELIEGVVYVASPVRIKKHSYLHLNLSGLLMVYQAATPLVHGGITGSVWLDPAETEVQPDLFLRVEESAGGGSSINEDDYLEGTPELLIEVSASTEKHDLTTKKRVYAKHGVQEYLVVEVKLQKIHWFTLHEGVYEIILPNKQGIFQSEIFPGLWLDEVAFWAGDLAQMLAVLQTGLASAEHAHFVAELKNR